MVETADGAALLGAEERAARPIDNLGVAEDRITTAVDVSAFLDHKRRAMEAHASQISETSFFLSMPPEAFAAVWGTEWYIRVGADADPPLRGLPARPRAAGSVPEHADDRNAPVIVGRGDRDVPRLSRATSATPWWRASSTASPKTRPDGPWCRRAPACSVWSST